MCEGEIRNTSGVIVASSSSVREIILVSASSISITLVTANFSIFVWVSTAAVTFKGIIVVFYRLLVSFSHVRCVCNVYRFAHYITTSPNPYSNQNSSPYPNPNPNQYLKPNSKPNTNLYPNLKFFFPIQCAY